MLATGAPSLVAAISTSTRRASAAATRICLPPSWMPVEPEAPPWFTVSGGVAHDDLDGLERHVEFLGHDLADGDVQAVAHVHLAEIGMHAAVGIDRDVGRQLIGGKRRLRSLRVSRVDRQHGVERHGSADRNDQRAAAEQHRAAGKRRRLFKFCHDALPQPIIVAARLTALRMLMCVPQRHLRPERASLISASLGFFFFARNSAAVMIQPLMQ